MEFHDAAAESDVPRTGGLRVVVAGRAVALFRGPRGIVAVDDRCPHAGAPLSEGVCRGAAVVCAWHGHAYDAATGACVAGPPALRATPRPVRVEGGRVLVGA